MNQILLWWVLVTLLIVTTIGTSSAMQWRMNREDMMNRWSLWASGKTNMGRGDMMRSATGQKMRDGKDMKAERKGSGMTLSAKILTAEQLNCAGIAVAKRESSLAWALSSANSAQVSGMTTRSASLASAWQIADGSSRKESIDSAWSIWKGSMDTAQSAHQSARESALTIFKTEMQTCKVDALESPMMGDKMMKSEDHN